MTDLLQAVGAHHPVRQQWNETGGCVVEAEPSRPARVSCRRIYGDDLQIEAMTKAQEIIVGTHAHVPASGHELDTKLFTDELTANIKVWHNHDKVIKDTIHSRSSLFPWVITPNRQRSCIRHCIFDQHV